MPMTITLTGACPLTMPIRSLSFLVLLLAASSAQAAKRPGGPPWSCLAISACSKQNVCAALIDFRLVFDLYPVEQTEDRFMLEGHGSQNRSVVLSPSLEDARQFIATDKSKDTAAMVIIRNDLFGDAHSFWAYSTLTRGTGERILSDDRMLIACSSIRRR